MKPTAAMVSTLAFLLAFSPVIGSQVSGRGGHPPFVDSDIATDGAFIYAVTARDQTIMRRPVGERSSWEPLVSGARVPLSFGQIGGLAAVPGRLYVVDSKARSVTILSLSGREIVSIKSTEIPLMRPESIAVVGAHIFLADSEAGRVIRMTEGQPVTDVLDTRVGRPGVRIFVAADRASLFIGRADGMLATIDSAELANKIAPQILQHPEFVREAGKPTFQSQPSRTSGSEERRAVRPIAGSLYEGIAYFVDAADRGLYTIEPSSRKPMHIDDPDASILGPTRVVATERQLFVLSSDGELTELRRPVPAEVVAERSTIPQLVPRLYRFLRERRLLATRRVAVVNGDLEETLRRSRLLGSSVLHDEFRAIVCDLNPAFCGAGLSQLSQLPSTSWLVLPDWSAESYIDQRRVELDNSHSLKEELDRRVVSKEFAWWKTDDKIRSINAGKMAATSLEAIRQGTFYVPTELIRYLLPLPMEDFRRSTSEFEELTKTIHGLRIRSLERMRALTAGGSPSAALNDDFEMMAMAHDKMRATIKAQDLVVRVGGDAPVTKVGVADTPIHRTHPDFGDAFIEDDSPAIALRAVETTALPPNGESSEESTNKRWHEFDAETDHGTAVASLIGAMSFQFKRKGLAAGIPLMSLRKDNPDIRDDVKNTFLYSRVRVFNLSFSYPLGLVPAVLGEAMDDLPQALFVVAAGNHWAADEAQGKICEGTLVIYPACYSEKPNVLVVTATNLDGTQLLQPIPRETTTDPGANWHPRLVHLAAPGDGYYASGYPEGYVQVRGSSFATPLVTAAAAALYSLGITDPLLIKQRLIATADRVPALKNYVYGGLLNVKRALQSPSKAVVVMTRDGKKETRVISLMKSDPLRIALGPDNAFVNVPASNVRRLVRVGNRVCIIYAAYHDLASTRVGVPDQLNIVEVRPGDWNIRYREVDPTTLVDTGPLKSLNLGTVEDYVGPLR